MLSSYIYVFIEMLMIIIGLKAIDTAKRHSPRKIRGVAVFVLTLEIIRFAANILLFISKNILFLYTLKFFALINLVVIPITAILCFYIFLRSDELNFDYIIFACAILFIIYAFTAFNMDYFIQRTNSFGYFITFQQWVYIELALIAILSSVLVASIITIGRKVSNNIGLMLIIVATVIVVAEIVAKLFEIQVMPNLLFSDFVWILVLQYALSTFKLNKGR